MLAVEGFSDRLDEGGFLRVIDDHRDPGNALQRHPMAAEQMQGGDQGEGSGEAGSQSGTRVGTSPMGRKRIVRVGRLDAAIPGTVSFA